MELKLENKMILRRIIKTILSINFPEAIEKGDRWNFRCNICKDSKTRINVKRGWIYKDDMSFHCFNCGKHLLVTTWLRQYYSSYYHSYISECVIDSIKNADPQITPVVEEKVEVEPIKEEIIESDIKYFKPIESKYPISKLAIEYVQSRLIPENIWKKWYVAIDGRYKDRLIIPYFDSNNEIYYWQGRSLVDADPKYLNKLGAKEIYNYHHINKNDPVIAHEGVINSLFVENSIAVGSTNWSQDIEKMLSDLNIFWLIDYDKNNTQTIKRCEELILKKKYVFIWGRFIRDHGLPARKKWDINDVVRYTKRTSFTFKELKPYFSNNLYDSIYFRV